MKIVSNSAISLDGKINTAARTAFSFGSSTDQALMKTLRDPVDAVLVGGNAFRHWPEPRLKEKKGAPLWNVVLSRSMDVPLTGDFFCEKNIKRLFLTESANVPDDFPCEVAATAQPDVTWVISQLEKRGVKTLMVEGGGDLIYQFLKAEQLDEMFVTLCPKIFAGRDVPSLVDGVGFKEKGIKDLILLEAKPVENEVFLHYEVIYDNAD